MTENARTGGLVATALLGFVLTASGAGLAAAFDFAMVAGAAICVAASASARLLEWQASPEAQVRRRKT
jgi:hypothetical protein